MWIQEVFAGDSAALDTIQKDLLLVFPFTPRTVNRLKQFDSGMNPKAGET